MMSEHRARYKNKALNPEELRRRREEDSVQLRKQKRDDFLSKKRTITQLDPADDSDDGKATENGSFGDQLTPALFDGLRSSDLETILECAKRVRKCLSKEPDPPFEEVINSGIIPRLVELLDYNLAPLIQFEVAWILTNISSSVSEHTRVVAESGAVPKLIQLINTNDVKLQEQAIWALGNIIGDGIELRDAVIACNFIPPMLETIRPDMDISFLRNLAWVVVNLCRYKDPAISLDIVEKLIPKIQVLLSVGDDKVSIDATWAISYIIELGPEYFDLVLDEELIKCMIPILNETEPRLLTSVVRAFGCMAAGSDDQTQIIINAGVLPVLSMVLNSHNNKIAKDTLWLVSNVAAGTGEQVQALIDAGFIKPIIHYLRVGDFSQQKEATWAVYNLTITGSKSQVKVLVDEMAVHALCDLLTLTDPTILKKSLESLKGLLNKCSDYDPPVTQQIEECGGLDKIESLQNSQNNEIYSFAYEIIDNYFSQEDVDR